MPILFNQSDYDSLLSVIKREVAKAATMNMHDWIFFAITCYFNPKTAEELIRQIKQILGSRLVEVHILLDVNEWIKQCVNRDEFVHTICQIASLAKGNVSFTPISYDNKLFHAKSYALINSEFTSTADNDNGFAIVTSGNLTVSGLTNNIEIGHVVRETNSLNDFITLFSFLRDNFAVSPEQEAEHREFQLAVKVLSSGNFYHKWHPSFDLIFRLTLSRQEKKRLHDLANNKETKRKLEDFLLKKIKTIQRNPINIQSVFKVCPRVIPADFWATYSIETLLGQWVPSEISKLIDQEVEQSLQLFEPILEEISTPEKIDEYIKILRNYVDKKLKEQVIDLNADNLAAIETWQKRVKRFFTDKNLLKAFICKYEKINLPISQMEREFILTLYQRIKDFYGISSNHRGLGKTFAGLEDDFFYTNLSYEGSDIEIEFTDLVKKAKERLNKNRIGELDEKNENKINPGEAFVAFEVGSESKDGKNVETYKRLDGIFLRLEDSSENSCKDILIYQKQDDNEEEKIPVRKLRTFKKQSEKNSNENE